VYPVLFHLGPIVVPSYGVLTALGVLVALALLVRTAHIAGLNPNPLWSLSILALFAALVGSRLVLLVVNWTVLRTHPAWLLGLALVHHPLVSAIGAGFAIAAAIPYARAQRLALRPTLDALAAPTALALSCEQLGALLSGSGYGTETNMRWAVVYTDPLAAQWSGAPLFVAVHPVQGYAALAFFVIALGLLFWMPYRGRPGEIAGGALLAIATAIYFTEFFRDPEGRGSFLSGAVDGPQLASVGLLLLGALFLLRRPGRQAIDPVQSSGSAGSPS
jgi:phosphatidylglycerol---prolipoprotein diacylglyceryl transferase